MDEENVEKSWRLPIDVKDFTFSLYGLIFRHITSGSMK